MWGMESDTYLPSAGDRVTVLPSRLGTFPGVWVVESTWPRYDGPRVMLVPVGGGMGLILPTWAVRELAAG
jgi:hypothetical protein